MLQKLINEALDELRREAIQQKISSDLLRPMLGSLLWYFAPYFLILCALLVIIVGLLTIILFRVSK
jgi:hypothetical protein